ncbi:hypothetical protein ACTFIU_002090 [Dictyostelium citrinum]
MFDETETERKSGGSNTNGNSSSNTTLPCLQAVSTTVFRRTRSKLTSRWTSVTLQTSLERIGSSKLLSRGSQWIKSPRTTKLQIDAQPNIDINSRGSEIEQVLPNQYSKLVFYSNLFTVPKPGTNLLRPVLDLKRLNTFIANQSFKMEGIKSLPSMVKQGYYMVKLDIKKAYLHVLVDPNYRDLFRFIWKGVHYRWKTMPFGLSTAPRIFTMLLRPVLRMLRELNVSVIAYLDDLLIVGSTKEECLSNLDKTMKLLVKLGFKLNLEKSVLEPTQSITFLGLQIDSVSMQKADRTQRCSHPIPIVHSKNKQVPLSLHIAIKRRLGSIIRHPSRCQVRDLKLVNSVNSMEWQRDKSVSKLRLCSYNLCFRITCRCNSKERKQDNQHMVIPVVSDSIKHVIESSRDARSVNGLPRTMSESQQLQSEDSNRQHNNSLLNQSPRWSNPGSISPLRTALEAVFQEESQLDWRAHSRILQCQSRPPQQSCRVESQVIKDYQNLQLATQEGSIQSHPTSPQPSNDKLLYNQNECTPTRLESM